MRAAYIGGGVVAASAGWTVLASAAYAWIGRVPFHCWWYYAVPWPDDFVWSGLVLIVSSVLAAVPFGIFAWLHLQRRQSKPKVYGETKWAGSADMANGGIAADRMPF